MGAQTQREDEERNRSVLNALSMSAIETLPMALILLCGVGISGASHISHPQKMQGNRHAF